MKWTENDLATLIELYPTLTAEEVAQRVGKKPEAVYVKAAKMGLKKAPDFYKNLHKTLNNKGTFKKGNKAWNKNMKGLRTGGDAGFFKKGHIPHTTKENGTITVRYDEHGRIWLAIKVENNKWVRYSHYVFSQYYGEVPKGMCIRHRNDNHIKQLLES